MSGGMDDVREVLTYAKRSVLSSIQDMWRRKLGLSKENNDLAQELFSEFEDLTRRSCGDWTITWRQLADVALVEEGSEDEKLVAPLLSAFYEPLTEELREGWIKFLKPWRSELMNEGTDAQQAAEQIRNENPMFIPREWMLVEAYKQADQNDFTLVHELYELFKDPYGVNVDQALVDKYYRLAPKEAFTKIGTASMT
uniref:Selenoprotein O n=1 Tax=Hanusia phi TaxID=3032 RepID=A0A7S0EUP7_9CRYP